MKFGLSFDLVFIIELISSVDLNCHGFRVHRFKLCYLSMSNPIEKIFEESTVPKDLIKPQTINTKSIYSIW